MTKLVGENVLARTAAILLTRAQDRLVVRVGIDYVSGEFPHIGLHRQVSIYLLTFCQNKLGKDGGFFEVRYTSDGRPAGWYKADFRIKSLHTSGHLSPELYALPEHQRDLAALEGQLALWYQVFPPFVDDAEVESDIRDRDGTYRRTPTSRLDLMLHCAHLYGRLEQVQNSGLPEAWAAETFLKRLGSFIGDRLEHWELGFG